MNYAFLDRKFIKSAHEEGLDVYVCKIDELHLLGKFTDMGVDGIVGDNPRTLWKYLR